MTDSSRIRNVAIIAHVDHGKTTLVDGLLKQSNTFRANSSEMSQTTILDTGELERERGITIRAKTTQVSYDDYKINIIDTPGHVDFSGEVERTLGMADGCLLIIDAQEGPMPQTKFVLGRALALGLQPIVVVNKIDKPAARAAEVVEETGSLFLDLAVHHDQLDFPVYYAVGREGKAFAELPDSLDAPGDLTPIFRAIIDHVPAPEADPAAPFQMLVTSLDWDSYQGKYAIGRARRGVVRPGQELSRVTADGAVPVVTDKVFTARGLGRVEVSESIPGDLVWITGIPDAQIGETLTDRSAPEALPVMEIEAPTLRVAIGPNTSPFAGKEGSYTTSRQIGARLKQELETNVSLRVEEKGTHFYVSGRGELHLSVLIETLRREGYEFEVGRPSVVVREEGGQRLEPVEEVIIEVPALYEGAVTGELGRRRARLVAMTPSSKGVTEFVYRIPTRALLGVRGLLLRATKGTVVMNSLLAGFEAMGPPLQRLRNGVLISSETGVAVTYSLKTVEERGVAFVTPGTRVYQGMIVGLNRRSDDMEINVCKEKKLTNVRASATDMTTQLTPATILSLEEALEFLEDDELLEVTPQSLRLRKRYLLEHERRKHRPPQSSD